MTIRRRIEQLKRTIGDADSECLGVLVSPPLLEAEDPDPTPPQCPLCGKAHWAKAQGIQAVRVVHRPEAPDGLFPIDVTVYHGGDAA